MKKYLIEKLKASRQLFVSGSAIEIMSDDELEEESSVLTAEIEAAEQRLSSVENEIFYRNNPECRRH